MADRLPAVRGPVVADLRHYRLLRRFRRNRRLGQMHLDLLRKFAPYYNGIPCERWLRALVNRINPETFASCFEDWIHALRQGRHIYIAIDGKTRPRTHDKP